MARRFFRLSGVPDDEAQEVRALLEDAQIEYFETTAGFLHLSVPAIWLVQDEDLERAIHLLQAYQQQRQQQAQQDTSPRLSFWQRAAFEPLRTAGILLAVMAVALLGLLPMLLLFWR
ncbi:DUF6164 family protein [Marinospirillum sp. MEB164]|uniref:DUF6164 family protein n=1 Tax=Marinospirillum alkalitolerans TaxID=3123374 RepID=A0ABW8PYW3_9GAMM